MNKEELICRLTDKQKEYDWHLLPEEFTYSTPLQYICHKKDELGNEHGTQTIKLGKILRGDGCPICRGKGMTKELFVYKANLVHNNSYLYDRFNYVDKRTKGIIFCPKHNVEFQQTPAKHLIGQGCPKCRYEKSAASKTKTTEEFVEEANKIWGERWIYTDTEYKKGQEKVSIICPIHGKFWMTPNNHIHKTNPQGCPQCGKESSINSRTMTFSEFVEVASKVHNNKYKYVESEFTKASDMVGIICPIHGKFYQRGVNHTCLQQGCPKCSNQQSLSEEEIALFLNEIIPNAEIQQRNRKIINPYELDIVIPSYNLAIEYNGLVWHSDKFTKKDMEKKKIVSTEDFVNKARGIFGEYYDYSKTDISKKDEKRRVTITCPIHGDFLQNMYSHLKGCGCPKCGKEKSAKTQTFTNEEFINKCNIIHNNKYIYTVTRYKGATEKVDIICHKHGVFSQMAYSHLQGHGCPKCASEQNAENLLLTKEEFIEKANKVHKGTENYHLVEYKGAKVPVQIICKYGHTYWQMPNKHLQGHSCPYCSHNVSKQENEITEFLNKELNIETDNNNRKILGNGKEIDITIPSKNTAIEFNGLIWHSEQYGGNKEYYHLDKTVACNSKGIRLIHIFEDEWLYKKDIVKSKLKEILNCSPIQIKANNCEIKKISKRDCTDFLNNNSIQGKVKSSFQYGLYNKNELVSVIALKKCGNKEFEILAYCNKMDSYIIGGEKKMLNYLIEVINPNRITICFDRRWDNGENFEKIGFKYRYSSSPKYYYVVGKHRKDWSEFTKNKLIEQGFDKDKTVEEIMEERGIYKIYDCGMLIFDWKRQDE